MSALELAFLAPVFLLLIFFSIQAALFFYGRNVAIQAAREGVSQLRLAQTYGDYQNIQSGVVSNTEHYATAIGRTALNDPVATPEYDDAAGRVSMRVKGTVITLVPGLKLKVDEHAEGPVERFRGVER